MYVKGIGVIKCAGFFTGKTVLLKKKTKKIDTLKKTVYM